MSTTIKVKVTLDHVSGPEVDADTLLDFFAAVIGEQNGAGKQALSLSIASWDDPISVYKVVLVDQA